jgi:hypothetical protein
MKPKINRLLEKPKIKLKKYSPTILTCLSTAGVVATTVLAVRATPKALRLIKAKKNELETEKLSPVELVQTTWQCYIPSALMGAGTIACIIGIGVVDRRNQAALTSAYAMLNESYKQYRQAAKQVYGEDADDKIHAEMAKDVFIYSNDWGYQVYNIEMDPESERMLFYDLTSKKYFNTTMASVLNAQYHVNRNLSIRGDCSLNEYLSFLGLDGIVHGDEIGWDISYLVEEMDCYWLDFDNHKTTLEDGLECILIDVMAPNKFE